MTKNQLNPTHYNIRGHHFWQIFLDRLCGYLGTQHKSKVKSVKLHNNDIEFTCTHLANISNLMINLFQAQEKDNKILLIPSYSIGSSKTSKSIWLFIPQLFNEEENCLIFKSYVNVYYEKTFPKLFTTQFIKHLNKIIELQDIVRRAGVQRVDFKVDGVKFTWPVYFLADKITAEIVASNIPGINFLRDEQNKIEVMTVGYAFAWAAVTGTNWSGDLKSLFESNDIFKSIYNERFSKIDTEKYSYCLDRIKEKFGVDTLEYTKEILGES